MEILTERAFILGTYPFRERDTILSFFTEGRGKQRGVARGARGKHSRFGAAFNTFSHVEIVFAHNPSREMVSVREASILASSIPLLQNLNCPSLLMALAELIERLEPPSQSSPEAYRLCLHAMNALKKKGHEGLIFLYFNFWILRLAGLFPLPFHCSKCGRPSTAISPGSLDLFCADCASSGSIFFSDAAVRAFTSFTGAPLDDLTPPATPILKEMDGVITAVRRHALQGELKSYPFLVGCDKLLLYESAKSSLRS